MANGNIMTKAEAEAEAARARRLLWYTRRDCESAHGRVELLTEKCDRMLADFEEKIAAAKALAAEFDTDVAAAEARCAAADKMVQKTIRRERAAERDALLTRLADLGIDLAATAKE